MSFFMPEVYAVNDKKEKGSTPPGMDPFNLVRLAGIEPTTPWFVAKYSIQLSYSRENCFFLAARQRRVQHLQKLVRLAGIEPTTPWFVAKYSIQLSYSRKN